MALGKLMKHAGSDTLKTLDLILREHRKHDVLVEKSPGSFYLKSKAFVHFHKDPTGIFVDLKKICSRLHGIAQQRP
jgi:hypothetical protein